MNNEPLSTKEKIHYTNLWCKELGIKSKDLGCGFTQTLNGKVITLPQHLQIDDVILLIKIRKDCWTYMNKEQKDLWTGWWAMVYYSKYPLKGKKLFNRLEKMMISVSSKIEHKKTQQQKIRQLRESKKQNGGRI